MSQGLKIFVAAGIGAIIGSVLSLQYHWFLALGMLGGAVVGYLAYQPMEMPGAIDTAWGRTRDILGNAELRKRCGLAAEMVGLMVLIMAILATNLVPAIVMVALRSGHHASPAFSWVYWIAIGLSTTMVLRGFVRFAQSPNAYVIREWCWEVSPLGSGPWIAYKLIRGVGWVLLTGLPKLVAVVIPTVSRFSVKFVWTVFKSIHSDGRLLCGVDAGFGTVAGYFAHNAVIGFLAGGVIGFLNYEIISKRWLKLVPMRT